MLMVDTQMRAETVEHLDDLGCFPFSQQINLQIEVISTIYDSTHSVLLDQHEGRQQYRLQRGDWKRIEGGNLVDYSDIDNDPGSAPQAL